MSNKSLSLSLTEDIVFIRAGTDSGSRRRRNIQPSAPAIIRGVLTLTLAKPIKISAIEVELEGLATDFSYLADWTQAELC